MILSDKHTAALNVMEKDLSSAYAIGIPLFKESGNRTAEEPVCNESHHLNSTRCSDSYQVENGTKFMASNQTLTVSSSNSTCIDEVGDCDSSGGLSLVLNSCLRKSSDLPSVSPVLELDRARYCGYRTACEGDDDKQDPAVGDVKVGSLDTELASEKSEGYKHFSPQKETLDLSSSSTLSNSMAPEEGYLDYAPQNLVHREAELSSLNNVEEQENDSQCGMPELSRTSKETSRTGESQEMSTTLVDSNQLGSKPTRLAQKSEFGLEEEEMDALEVARQVAIEVELEVVGYREHIINSPDLHCGEATGAQNPDLADSIPKNSQHSYHVIDDQMKHERVSESPRMMPAAEEQNLEMENSQCGFDLNEDVCKGETECSDIRISAGTAEFSTPIVAFASKGVPRFPFSSVRFDSESGWRGCSATSAFRLVHPRKLTEKAPDLKKKQNFLEIDLNVAATQNDYIADPASLISSDHLSKEYSMEGSSRKEKKLKLDLNLIEDEDISAKPSLNHKFQLHDVDHSFSTAASSSSSSKQHYTRDFDLNDDLTILFNPDDSSHRIKSTSEYFPTCRRSKPDDNSVGEVILCSSRSQQEPFLNNGLMHYSQITSAYGYNILKAGAAIPPPPPVLCGGTTLIPLGSSGFFPTVTHFAPCEAGRRDVEARFNHIFTHNGKVEENLRSSLQSSGSGMVLKRKEPDSRLEGYYPLGYKEMPFWK